MRSEPSSEAMTPECPPTCEVSTDADASVDWGTAESDMVGKGKKRDMD